MGAILSAEGTAPDAAAVAQLERCMAHPSALAGALMADHHKGYSMPIGGVVAYADQLSPSGVGFDIGCGNAAVLTDRVADEAFRDHLPRLMDAVSERITFGVGGMDGAAREHPIHDDPRWRDVPGWVRGLRGKARGQLGTVGGGNHYVNLMADELDRVWVCDHFGSRGLGHTIATGFLNLAKGDPAGARYRDDMDAPPVLIPAGSALGQEYDVSRSLAADYALAGRLHVAQVALGILGATALETINVHHNDYWREDVAGERAYVVRKGATPLAPGDRAYIGGSMTDGAAIVEGIGPAPETLGSAPHGAGRLMSRSQAKGNRKGTRPGAVTEEMMARAVAEAGVELRGGDRDESPFVYRRLDPVLAAHDNVRVVHRLRPLGVAMAPRHVRDPYRD
jgi:tRNA-splicing ligase RtcB (3'-phosphate/5'-hydroxy nucleic acid ligase)